MFPPTYFHSATFVPTQNAIFIIGCFGFETEKTSQWHTQDQTPVYRLEVGTWKIEKVDTTGVGPVWIWAHSERLEGNEIFVFSENVDIVKMNMIMKRGGERDILPNGEVGGAKWALNLDTMVWRFVTPPVPWWRWNTTVCPTRPVEWTTEEAEGDGEGFTVVQQLWASAWKDY